MNILVLILAMVFSYSALAEEGRIKMVDSVDSEKDMEKLMTDISESCNSGDYKEFMGHFTKKRSASIKKVMKDLFSKHELEMQILSVEPLKEDENSKEFNLRYSWDSDISPQKQIITSTVVAKKEKSKWKVDSEKIKNVDLVDKENHDANLNFGGAGQVVLNDNNDDFLPRDIAKRPGGGCADGKCGVR